MELLRCNPNKYGARRHVDDKINGDVSNPVLAGGKNLTEDVRGAAKADGQPELGKPNARVKIWL